MSESTTPPLILVAEDDPSNLESLERILIKQGFRVLTAKDGQKARELLSSERTDILLSDLMMPGFTGIDLLKVAKAISPETQVILMTAYGTVETAVRAMKDGAYDFITKPFSKPDLLKVIGKALDRQALVLENRDLKDQLRRLSSAPEIVGNSPRIRKLLDTIRQVAPTEASVLIEGETGTGKELIARAIHTMGLRADKPFIAVNCAALPESIIESELFGYEKGAFTGAQKTRAGRFELAHGGTLFLDEIGEIPLQVQVKLLRVLQEGTFERLGAEGSQKADVRVIAATNRKLKTEVDAGRFRQDLYYRLNVITVDAAPLREHKSDIPLLVERFIKRFAEKNKKNVTAISRQALDALMSHEWPGNVRELENLIERSVVLCQGAVIDVDTLPPEFYDNPTVSREIVLPLGTPLEDIKARVIDETLKLTKGDKKLAAQLLGIATRTIYRKLS